jgi:hypothetical protein
MPRPVVPILPLPAAASRMPSSSRCSGRISTAFSAMRKLSGVISTSCDCSLSISSASAHGSITTPLPITDCLPGRTMPDGSNDSL